MKIIAVVGSPHGLKGNTARLLRLVLAGAEREGASTETILLPGNTVLPCLGCDTCHKKGRCPQKDGFEVIQEKIRQADGLVLASPNYIFSVSAQMKAFMDRCCCAIHCLGFEGKYGASVITSGGGDEPPIAEYMNHFLITTGIRPVGAVWATMGLLENEEFTEAIETEARALGVKLVQAWKNKLKDPEVEEQMAAFRSRMHDLIAWRKDEWPYEYGYWKDKRGME